MTATTPAGDPFEALGDPRRREILRLLGAGERSVQELAADLLISRAAVSRRLRLLKDAGLVVEEARGTRRIYRLQDRGLDAVRAHLERVRGESATRFRLIAENTEGRVGGRVYERTAGGVEHDWGEVTVWEPPYRLAYTWFPRADRADATDVEITFVAERRRPRIDIEHRRWERLGVRGEGWSTLLPHFRPAVVR